MKIAILTSIKFRRKAVMRRRRFRALRYFCLCGLLCAGAGAAKPGQNVKAKGTKHPVHKASPPQGWHGSGSLGLSLSTGNTQSRSFTGDLDATYQRHAHSRWRSVVKATALLAHSTSSGGAKIVSNTLSGGVREERKLSRRNYLFALGQWDYIQPQGIHLRQTYGGGYGRELLLHPRLRFGVLTGLTYVRTRFIAASPLPAGTALVQNSAEALLGETLHWRPGRFLRLTHALNFYPNLSQGGQYRFDTNTILAAPISRHISLTFSFVDFFLSHPLPGNRRNNSSLAAGLGFKF